MGWILLFTTKWGLIQLVWKADVTKIPQFSAGLFMSANGSGH